MPSYVIDAVPFRPKTKADVKFMTAEALAETMGFSKNFKTAFS